MKRLLFLIPLLLLGCNTTQQQLTFNALQSIESVADAGYNSYTALVVKGTVSTNAFAEISRDYNMLHADIVVAADLDQAGTNMLVSTNLTVELGVLLNAITVATQGH